MKKIIASAILLATITIAGAAAPTMTFTYTVNSSTSPVTPTLTWSSAGAVDCNATASPVDTKWLGSVGASGTKIVGPITTTTTYTLTCSTTADKTATLSWVPPTLNTDGTPLTDLAGFNAYEVVGGTPVLVSHMTQANYVSLPIINLQPGVHSFYLTAYNLGGLESPPSNTGTKTILAAETTVKSITVNVSKQPAPPQTLTVK